MLLTFPASLSSHSIAEGCLQKENLLLVFQFVQLISGVDGIQPQCLHVRTALIRMFLFYCVFVCLCLHPLQCCLPGWILWCRYLCKYDLPVWHCMLHRRRRAIFFFFCPPLASPLAASTLTRGLVPGSEELVHDVPLKLFHQRRRHTHLQHQQRREKCFLFWLGFFFSS